jgi:hypothetical protein
VTVKRAHCNVPLEPFQDRARLLMARGEELADMAARADVFDHRGRGDSSWLRRALGFGGYTSRGKRYHRTHVTEDVALKLCRALDLDPWEAGI